jgi:Leucine-rich repeat (LRR) protein
LSNLTALTVLDLTGNDLQSPLPDLGALTGLITLKLGANQFTGTIPTWVNTPTALTTLELQGNQFVGPMPDLSALAQLQVFNIGGNQFTGSVPLFLAQLITLTNLDLSSNQFDGTIPDLSTLTALKSLSLNSNRLTGDIPLWLNTLTNLEYVFLNGNQLTGTLPDLSALTGLEVLNLSANQLSGSIPASIGNMTSLLTLDLGSNLFSGGIPSEIGNLTAVKNLYLSDNRLSGAVPAELGNLTALQYLGLESNGLTGSIPGDLVNLTALYSGGLDIRYNGLYTADSGLKSFLDGKQDGSDWESTQTVAPAGIAVSEEAMDSVKVQWTPIAFQSTAGEYRVYYSTTPGSGYTLAGSTADKTEDNFVVTGLDAETTYYFVVETFSNTHSNNDNAITSEYSAEVSGTTLEVATLTVISPNTGESWEGNSNQTITWNSTGVVDDVKLEYSTDNGASWNTIIASTPNSGSYGWLVPNTPSAQCLVRVSDTAGSTSDVSNGVFTILMERAVTVTSPNGGQRWFIGSVYPVTWTTTGSISTVNIEYSADNGGSWNFIVSIANNGSYNWTIPNSPSAICLVKVSDASGTAFDVSNSVFTIDPYPTITVTSPNGGQNWDAGTTQTVTWSYTGTVAAVDIEYSADGGGSWNTIASAVSNTGSYDWALPTIDSANCLVRVSDIQTAASDTSNNVFGIWQAPSVTVTSPDGGEVWAAGSVQTITWDTTGQIGSVSIEYTRNNGKRWDTVTSSTANTGSYQWTVPSQNKTYYQCLVRITALDNSGSDVSNGFFTILK